jgi:hypothetical protein
VIRSGPDADPVKLRVNVLLVGSLGKSIQTVSFSEHIYLSNIEAIYKIYAFLHVMFPTMASACKGLFSARF